MIVFGASALYGWLAEARCVAIRNDVRERELQAMPGAPHRMAFPFSVLDFRFESTPADAEAQCRSTGGAWHLEGAVATCVPQPPKPDAPDVQLEFRYNTLFAITLSYHSAPEDLRRDYDALNQGQREVYGPPQVEASPFSSACAASLASCLSNGEHPKGPVWHWPRGTIELTPLLIDGAAVIRLHYAREDAD